MTGEPLHVSIFGSGNILDTNGVSHWGVDEKKYRLIRKSNYVLNGYEVVTDHHRWPIPIISASSVAAMSAHYMSGLISGCVIGCIAYGMDTMFSRGHSDVFLEFSEDIPLPMLKLLCDHLNTLLKNDTAAYVSFMNDISRSSTDRIVDLMESITSHPVPIVVEDDRGAGVPLPESFETVVSSDLIDEQMKSTIRELSGRRSSMSMKDREDFDSAIRTLADVHAITHRSLTSDQERIKTSADDIIKQTSACFNRIAGRVTESDLSSLHALGTFSEDRYREDV